MFHRALPNALTRRVVSTLQRTHGTMAITRNIPDSFQDALVEHYKATAAGSDDRKEVTSTTNSVNISLAREQHQKYMEALHSLGCFFVADMLADEALPDCPFVEDTAVVIRQHKDNSVEEVVKTVLLNPGHKSRQPEVDLMRAKLPMFLPGTSEIYDMAAIDPRARCDGGDILYTGRHLFVGVSERTNEEALTVLEQVFHEIPLIPVELPKHAPVLHLKSAVTHLDENTLVAPTAPWANQLLRNMRLYNELENEYDVIRIHDVLACNAVVLPEGVVLQKTKCSESHKLLLQAMQARDLDYIFVDTSELAKKDGALTCCSIILPFDNEEEPERPDPAIRTSIDS